MCSYGETECPLCGDELSKYDLHHPLQCPTQHCSFNFCLSCAEKFVESTKGENEASDGNTFRVFLHCPNCRSNLGPSIRDTVLIRKVEKYSSHAKDGDLTEREVRFRYALRYNEDIKSAVKAAQSREDEFFNREEAMDNESRLDSVQISRTRTSMTSISERSLWIFGDEEGFEVDLTNGVHKSFIFRHQSMRSMSEDSSDDPDIENLQPDLTLLSGLDAFMTEQEKKYATYLMTSGDPSKLAAATDMLNYVSTLSRSGIRPSTKRLNSSNSGEASFAFRRRDSLMGSIREIIKEGNETRLKEEEKTHIHLTGGVVSPHLAGNNRSNRRRQVDLEVKRQMEYMRLHPLPLRMPKYAEVLSRGGALHQITFVDDIWDGYVIDAFAKITVYKPFLGKTMHIKKQHAESMGISSVLNAGPAGSPRQSSKIDVDTPRILVASINREMGQKGVVKGDVITHVNGEEYKGTANELRKLVDSLQQGEIVTFAFNCDQAVAEALKRRSFIP